MIYLVVLMKVFVYYIFGLSGSKCWWVVGEVIKCEMVWLIVVFKFLEKVDCLSLKGLFWFYNEGKESKLGN